MFITPRSASASATLGLVLYSVCELTLFPEAMREACHGRLQVHCHEECGIIVRQGMCEWMCLSMVVEC